MEKTIKIEIPEGYDDVVFNKETNEIKFVKEDSRPRSWEEYRKQKRHTDCFRVFLGNSIGSVEEGNRVASPCVNEFNAREEAKAIIALCKLIQLRDAWWGNWKPDWNDTWNDNNVPKYGISNKQCHTIGIDKWYNYNRILVFPTAEMRDEFLNTFRDLIEEAKSLL